MKFRIDVYLKNIVVYHELVARKLRMAQRQLRRASTVEEYQQVGILLRDAWIEFSKKIFSPDFVPEGEAPPGRSDAKAMLSLAVAQWPDFTDKLKKLCNTLIDLANEIQHRTSIDELTTEWCLLNTAIAMSLLLELDCQHDGRASRRYYTCPNCGSLNLTVTKDREVNFDGPGPEYESWECGDCDWQHFIYLG